MLRKQPWPAEWIPSLAELVDDRPELAGVGLSDVLPSAVSA